MGRAILIRLDETVDAQATAVDIERALSLNHATVDVIGWPPARDEIDRLTDTS